MCACSSNEKGSVNNVLKRITVHDKIYYEVPLQKSMYDDIVALSMDSIIFYSYKSGTNRNYYKYNILSGSIVDLGIVNDAIISNDSSALINDALFFNVTTGTWENPINKLYCIDLKGNKLKEVMSDKLFQTFVYTEAISNSIILLKGDQKDILGITYIEELDPISNISKKLIEEEFNSSSGSGKVIKNISCYNDRIFAIICEYNKSKPNYKIYEYNRNGNIEKIVDINNLKDMLEKEQIDEFKVMGNYFFIKTFSGQAVICGIDENEAFQIINSEYKLDIAQNSSNQAQDYYVFFQRKSNKNLILLDSKNNNIMYIDLDFVIDNDNYTIRYIVSDNEYNLIISFLSENRDEEKIYYLNILDFLKDANEKRIDNERVLHID